VFLFSNTGSDLGNKLYIWRDEGERVHHTTSKGDSTVKINLTKAKL